MTGVGICGYFILHSAVAELQKLTIAHVCYKVDNMNQSNEDGLTVLHNGVCSGCQDILEFLVHAGCDVNVADCDGWFVFVVI